MINAEPVISRPATQPPPAPTGPGLPELCAAARTAIQPFRDSDQRFGPDLERGFTDLAQLIDDFERKHVVCKVASYRLEEALGSARRIRDTAIRERGRASSEVRDARDAIASLSTVHAVVDLEDGLIDREIRDVVRAMTPAKRAELLELMRKGVHVRAMLASARHPMPTDFDLEAAKLYSEFSHPAKRRNLAVQLQLYQLKHAAAQVLIDSADAAKAIVARFIELEAPHQEQGNADLGRPLVTRGDVAPPAQATAVRAPIPHATLQIEGSAITRLA